MDGGGGENLMRAISARLSSSNIWKSSGREGFSFSSSEEKDEEALKWASLEKLPTFARIRTGILSEEEGRIREIDVKKLGAIEKRNLVDRLVRIAEESNENFLLKLKERINRVGIVLPKIEVRFENLNVDAEAYVGGRALPTIFNFFFNAFQGFLNYLHILPSRKIPLAILHDVSGIIKPGRLTLLLGPPSSGKTTLLLALAGELDADLKAISLKQNHHLADREESVFQDMKRVIRYIVVTITGTALSNQSVKFSILRELIKQQNNT